MDDASTLQFGLQKHEPDHDTARRVCVEFRQFTQDIDVNEVQAVLYVMMALTTAVEEFGPPPPMRGAFSLEREFIAP